MTYRSFVIVQPHLEYGGAERQTVLLANRLTELGVDTHLVLHERKGGLLSELNGDVKIWDLGLENHAALPLTALRLHRVLSRIAPSFVVLKLWSTLLAAYAVDKYLPQHVFNYCEDLDPVDHSEYIAFGKTKQRIITRVFRNRKHLTANTHSVASSMVDVYRLDHTPAVISSVVDIPDVQSKAGGVSSSASRDSTLRVCSVGTLIDRKGLLVTLEALRIVSTKRKVEWVIVGEGPQREQLEAAARSSGEHLTIKIHGGTPNPYEVMKNSEVLVHAARSEAFGIVILEALALGLRVVAADSIGPSEMQTVLGVQEQFLSLFPRGDAVSLSNILTNLNSSPVNVTEFEDYVRPYTLDFTVSKWINRHDELCGVIT